MKGLGLPNTGCDVGVAMAEVNEKVGPDDATMDDPNATGALLGAAAEAVDAANGNPVEGDAPDAAKGNPVEDVVEAATEDVDAAKENPDEGDVMVGTEVVDDNGKENPVEGDVVAATEAVDAATDDPIDEDEELNVELEPNIGDFEGCQEPNKLEVVLPMALLELASAEEAEVPSPKAAPEFKGLAAGVDTANDELPEERAVLPANPNDGDGADELN